jgi:hypothetical protein
LNLKFWDLGECGFREKLRGLKSRTAIAKIGSPVVPETINVLLNKFKQAFS